MKPRLTKAEKWFILRSCLAQVLLAGFRRPKLFASIEGAFPIECTSGIVFTACDEVYFRRYALALTRSVLANSPGEHVHVHVYNPSADCLDLLEASQKAFADCKVSFTWDSEAAPGGPTRPMYFAAARFIILHKLMATCSSAVMALDCDSIVRSNLGPIISAASDSDVRLFSNGKRYKEQRRKPGVAIKAGTVVLSPTAPARRFSREVALTIEAMLPSLGRYHIDQPILFYLVHLHRVFRRDTRFAFLPRSLIDWEFDEASIIWTGKGQRKTQDIFAAEVSRYHRAV